MKHYLDHCLDNTVSVLSLLPVVCHGLSLSEGFAGPIRDVVNPALFRPAPSSTAFDCSL